MRVYIETYGCPLNRSDEAIMKEVLVARGHTIVDSALEADAIILNTCVVRLETEYKMLKRIGELRELCATSGKKLIVAGCMSSAMPYTISKKAPEASIISPQNSHLVYLAVELPERVVLVSGQRQRDHIGLYFEGRIAPIPIQEGCTNSCSFCITKHARRALVSHSIEAVVNAVKRAISMGVVEIQLTGMDLGAYGLELYKKRSLPELLRRITREVDGNYMIRVGMINPEHLKFIVDDLIEAVSESPKVYKFFHIPLQSGSDRVLSIMRRGYTVGEYADIVKRIKRAIPDASIATDIIVGHPLETDEDFEATLKTIRELEFERVHLAAYSIRELTYSASLPQLPTAVKKRRALEAMKVIEEVGRKVREKYLNKVLECFVTEYNESWICRLDNYIPVVILDSSPNIDYGQRVRVRPVESTFFDLRALLAS